MPIRRQVVPVGSGGGSAPAAGGSRPNGGVRRGRGVYIDQLTVLGQGAGKVTHFPPLPLAPGQTVEIWPLPGNTGLVYTATNPDAVISAQCTRAAQANFSAPVPYVGLESLADLFLSSDVASEGVLARVLG